MAVVLLLLRLSILLMPLPSAAATAQLCGSGGNYTANSTYQSNLAVVAATLPNKASSSSQLFATATAGQVTDVVYALALCRGDTVNATACRDCVAASFQEAQRSCPYYLGATVYYDDGEQQQQQTCVLGFSSDDLLVPSITENDTLFQSFQNDSFFGDPGTVTPDVHDLLTRTAQDAAAAERRFATAVMDSVSTVTRTLYSLAQCTPDLSTDDCLACLQRIISMVNTTTAVRLGGQILVLRCNIRFEVNMFYQGQPMRRVTPSSITPVPPVPTTTTTTAATGKRHGIKPWVIAISVAAPVALVAFCFIVCYPRLRRRLREKRHTHELQGGDEHVWEMEAEFSEFSIFEFHQILEATNNFSEENKLGKGGFGPVYKGHFPDGIEIAVKRLDSHSGQGLMEFKNEVELIAKLQHMNLVRLLGCCSQAEEKILVYEYLPNKSLDFFIFDNNRKVLIDLNKRLEIIEGIAEGLLYLHMHSRLCVIHRDLKPSNILLDNEMNPKISDFGLAKIFSSNAEGIITRRVAGTYGYMAPEYASQGIFSIKSDVFSFGVLTLEILSGKRNSGSHQCGDFIYLLGYAWQLWKERRWIELVETSLLPNCHSTVMMRCVNIALLCVQENAVDRPTMLDVVAMLSSMTMNLPEPKHPAYFNLMVGNGESSKTTVPCSVNDVTISATTPR
ncbi:cysteine-rich receptor-like protein kinase 10 isoform X3 [Aegilops tauschii subsp. strangulata]|uniref:cysteine-rich receptor-like protein kinase 10 isoform X3 n=1 Tax=Aegilops tauschii subsp. strangulata TaxID=200361 RepID=UPI003CC8699F